MGKVGFLCISLKHGDEMRLNAICWQAREGLAQAALILLYTVAVAVALPFY